MANFDWVFGLSHDALGRCLLANDVKLLVAIASYGRKNDAYLERVLSEYRSMPCQTEFVVLSNIHKELGKDVEVITGTPTRDPWSLPFGHKRVFAERRDSYDLFIYSEDDMLVTQRNIEAFLGATAILPPQELAGFLQWEEYPDGRRFYPGAHSFYRWVPGSVKTFGDHMFARFSNDHSACFVLTRSQLARAIDSGGFLVPPHEYEYDLLVTAGTDPYTQCGFGKLICVSHFDDFIVHHLPDKYVGSRLGLDAPEFAKQMEALLHPHGGENSNAPLLDPKTKTFHCDWSKDCYEPCRSDLIDMFPSRIKAVLSIGCGWGKTEAGLARRGIKVTAIPLDSVMAGCAEFPELELVYGDLDSAVEQLRGRRFDGVLMSGILHLLPQPAKAIRQAGSLLAEDGILVATIPAFRRLPSVWRRIKHPSRYRGWGDFRKSGIHATGARLAKEWLREAGVSVDRISGTIPERWKNIAVPGRLAEALFSTEYVLVGRRTARLGV